LFRNLAPIEGSTIGLRVPRDPGIKGTTRSGLSEMNRSVLYLIIGALVVATALLASASSYQKQADARVMTGRSGSVNIS
jgi:hypothetical protein